MNNLARWLFVTALAMISGGLFAQVNDAQLWLSVNLEKKVLPAFSIHFTEELRMVENITEAGSVFTDIGASYRFLKRFRAGVFYRYSLKRRLDDTYRQTNSWYAEATMREKFKPVVLALRLRYQSRYAEVGTSEKAAIPEDHVRVKLTGKLDLDKKYEPYIYGETYFRTGVPASLSFDQLRLCAGVEYAFNRHHMVDLHYLFRREYNVAYPETDYVIGLDYSFSF